jgi:hypothetical protein
MSINMSLGNLRQLEALRDKACELAASEIKREEPAFYLFEALDEIPEGFDDECSDYCFKCAKKKVRKHRKLLPKDYDGPYQDHCNEGERLRACESCGCPLPQAMLKYGMESEIEHFEGEGFLSDKKPSDHDWYCLHTLANECLECEEHLNKYGNRVRNILVVKLLGKDHHSLK